MSERTPSGSSSFFLAYVFSANHSFLLHRKVKMILSTDVDTLFEFLSAIPNLRSLEYRWAFLTSPHFWARFFASVQHAPLVELVLETRIYPDYCIPIGPLVAGPTGLEKLSIAWRANEDEPGSSLARLYEIIRPSLSTLVSLGLAYEHEFAYEHECEDLDLQLLRPAGRTLRTFEYAFPSSDTGILDTISEIFPHLNKLSISWGRYCMLKVYGG
jgi:hypothetical protein